MPQLRERASFLVLSLGFRERITTRFDRHFLDLIRYFVGPFGQRRENDLGCNINPRRAWAIKRFQVVQRSVVNIT